MTQETNREARAALASGLLLATIVTVSGGFTIMTAHPTMPRSTSAEARGDLVAAGKVSLREIRREAYCTDAVRRLAPGAVNIRLTESPDANTRILHFGKDGANIARCEFLPLDQAGDMRMDRMSVNQKRLHRQVIDAINMRIDVLEYRRG